jgi:hypothetical protein
MPFDEKFSVGAKSLLAGELLAEASAVSRSDCSVHREPSRLEFKVKSSHNKGSRAWESAIGTADGPAAKVAEASPKQMRAAANAALKAANCVQNRLL